MKIERNGTVLDVTRGAYELFFRDRGWNPAGGVTSEAASTRHMNPRPKPESRRTEPHRQDILFRDFAQPVSLAEQLENMTIKELTEYAQRNGINVDGAQKKGQIVSIIRAAMEE